MHISDMISVFPVAQQVVGLGTFALNSKGLARDCLNSISNLFKKKNNLKIEKEDINRLLQECEDHDYDYYEEERDNYCEEVKSRANFFLEPNVEPAGDTHYVKHLKGMALGVGRLIPFVGTALSLYRCTDFERRVLKDIVSLVPGVNIAVGVIGLIQTLFSKIFSPCEIDSYDTLRNEEITRDFIRLCPIIGPAILINADIREYKLRWRFLPPPMNLKSLNLRTV